MLHPSVRPVTPVWEAVLEGHPLHLPADFTMCKKYKISSIHRSQMEAIMTTTKDLWSWGFLTKIVRRQFCPWGSNNIATSVMAAAAPCGCHLYIEKMSKEVMLFTSCIYITHQLETSYLEKHTAYTSHATHMGSDWSTRKILRFPPWIRNTLSDLWTRTLRTDTFLKL